MEKFEEKTIATTSIMKGKVINVQVDDVELPNGKKSIREIVKHPGAVGIIPITEDKKIIFVKQYRKALEKSLIEIPAGKLEQGESSEVTALRELEEETGYTTNELRFITSFYTAPGFSDEIIYLYETTQLEALLEKKALDDDEFVEIMQLSLEEAERLIETEEIHDAKTIFALQYLKQKGLN